MAASSRFAVATHICVAVGYLQKNPIPGLMPRSGLVPSHLVAGSVNTNSARVRQIVAPLVRAGLLKSTEGRAGGLQLARPDRSISLWDIYVAVGQPAFFAFNPSRPNPRCPISRSITSLLQRPLAEVCEGVQQKMSRVRLSDLMSQVDG